LLFIFTIYNTSDETKDHEMGGGGGNGPTHTETDVQGCCGEKLRKKTTRKKIIR